MTNRRKFANDDGNLNQGSIVTDRVRDYKDINMLFEVNPGTGDIYLSRDANAVKQAVRNLVLTNYHEKPFRPRVGANLREILFENIDPFTVDRAEDFIRDSIRASEPRAQVLSISIDPKPDSNAINITLEFLVVETRERVTLAVTLERLR